MILDRAVFVSSIDVLRQATIPEQNLLVLWPTRISLSDTSIRHDDAHFHAQAGCGLGLPLAVRGTPLHA